MLRYLLDQFPVPKVGFVLHMNENIAFSLPLPGALVSICAFFILLFSFCVWGRKYFQPTISSSCMLALIFSGAIGNILDRLFYNGAVVDFIKIFEFPIFNFADVCISSGVIVAFVWHKKIFR